MISKLSIWYTFIFKLILQFSIILLFLNACGESQYSQSKSEMDLEIPELYLQHCGACHGEDGSGGIGRALNGQHIIEMSEAQLFMIIYDGIGNVMPNFKSTLSTEQISDLIVYIRSFSNDTSN